MKKAAFLMSFLTVIFSFFYTLRAAASDVYTFMDIKAGLKSPSAAALHKHLPHSKHIKHDNNIAAEEKKAGNNIDDGHDAVMENTIDPGLKYAGIQTPPEKDFGSNKDIYIMKPRK